jgi:RNA polymerase sigma factor (sigma-70 family)
MKIEDLYEKHWYSLYCYCKSIVLNKFDAEDIVADVFYSLIAHPEKIETAKSVKGYLWWKVKIRSIDFIRVKERISDWHDQYGYTLTDEDISNFEQYKEQGEVLKRIDQEIKQLPNKEGAIFKMSHVYGLTVDKIMAITGVSNQSIRNSNHRAMVKIRAAMIPKIL